MSGLIFLAESNGIIFRITQNHHQDVGGQVDQGLGGLHHVGGGVVQTIGEHNLKLIIIITTSHKNSEIHRAALF